MSPDFDSDFEWVESFFAIHVLSIPSRRYSYYLWFFIVLIFTIVAVLHVTNTSTGVIGAYWNKWALRRRTIRKKHAQAVAWKAGKTPHPYSLPPNGQMLVLTALFVVCLLLSFVGPDFIIPHGGKNEFLRNVFARAHAPFDPAEFAPFKPKLTINKAWWTSANRTGVIAFALYPLVILFGIKQAPFAIFSIPHTMEFHFDKLVWLHRWTGRFIYFLAALHVIFWSVQLTFIDHRRGTVAYHYVWLHINFVYGWIAFGFFTLLILLSIPYIRTNFYETFYGFHVLLVPLFLIFSALHHPPLQGWCYAALGLWIGERLYRAVRWSRNNGFWSSRKTGPVVYASVAANAEEWEMKLTHSRQGSGDSTVSRHKRTVSDTSMLYKVLTPYARVAYTPPPGFAHAQILSGRTIRLTFSSPYYFSWAPGQHFLINMPHISKLTSHPFTCASICDQKAPEDSGRVIVFLIRAKGGWTKDLWNTVCSLTSQFKTHVPSERIPNGYDLPKNGALLRMFVDGPFGSSARARWGSHSTAVIVAGGSGVSFGLAVLEYICLCLAGRDSEQLGGKPSGWGGRGFRTTRVRFIWLVREFAHIQWCASALRRCLSLVPAPALQVDIFVTNFKTLEHERQFPGGKQPSSTRPLSALSIDEYPPKMEGSPPGSSSLPGSPSGGDKAKLLPPNPSFARHSRDPRTGSVMSLPSANSSVESFIDLDPVTSQFGDEEAEAGHVDIGGVRENYTIDLTNFSGDDDAALPGEETFSRKVRKTGKVQRAKTRKLKATATRQQGGIPWDSRQKFSHHVRDMSGETDMGNGHDYDSDALDPLSPLRNPAAASSTARFSRYGDTDSIHSLISQLDSMIKLQVEDDEMMDVNLVSECARPGKPKLDRIIADEVENSQGSVIIGC
jgi:hypothetical protein